MGKRDRETRRLDKDEFVGKLPVYQLDCELKRSNVIDAVNDIADSVDSNTAWLGRVIAVVGLLVILAIGGVVFVVFTHYRFKALEGGRTSVEERKE